MKKIFIADDDPDILEILSMMLTLRGYDVEASTNATDIFSKPGIPADLVLLDLWMSGIDGRDIYTKMKETENTKHIPVIFISANSHLPEIADQYKVNGFIAKPFDMNQLFKKVHEVLYQN